MVGEKRRPQFRRGVHCVYYYSYSLRFFIRSGCACIRAIVVFSLFSLFPIEWKLSVSHSVVYNPSVCAWRIVCRLWRSCCCRGDRGGRVVRVLIEVGVSILHCLAKLLQLDNNKKSHWALHQYFPFVFCIYVNIIILLFYIMSQQYILLTCEQNTYKGCMLWRVCVLITWIWWPDLSSWWLLWVRQGTPQPTSPTLPDLGGGGGHSFGTRDKFWSAS